MTLGARWKMMSKSEQLVWNEKGLAEKVLPTPNNHHLSLMERVLF